MISRIDVISSFIKEYKILCDIGTDHGYVIKNGFDKYNLEKAIAVDINKLPLENAKANLAGYPVKFVLSDGFKLVKDEFDVAVIAGLGGTQIIEILKERPNIDAHYVVSPNNNVHTLRMELNNLGLMIVDEKLVYENKHYYQIIKLKKGVSNLTEKEAYTGLFLKSDPLALMFYENQIKRYMKIYNSVPVELKPNIEKIISFYKEGNTILEP